MRALTALDGLQAAAERARQLDAQLHTAWVTAPAADVRQLRDEYLSALGQGVYWARRVIDEGSPGRCPLCRDGAP